MPKAKISWLLNGKELTLKDNVKFEADPKTSANNLIIPKINQTVHLGKYTIKASNSVGEVEHIFDLDVLGIFFEIILFKLSHFNFFAQFITKIHIFA